MIDYASIDQQAAQRLFHLYVSEGKGAELRALLQVRGDVDLDAADEALDQPMPAVHVLSVRPDSSEMLATVLEYGADPDAGRRYPASPITHASANAEVDNVRLLIGAGADALAIDRDGEDAYTSLDIYHDRSHELLEVLLNAGYSANHRFGKDGEPLLFSVNNNDMLPLLQTALKAGADPLAANETGETPLQIAGVRGEEAAEKLLAKYANLPRMKSDKTYSAEELMRPRNAGQRLVDNPANWSLHMEANITQLAEQGELPDRAALLLVGESGKSAAQVAFEARRGDLVLHCLNAHGETLQPTDLYDEKRKPTPLLDALCTNGQAALLFDERYAGGYSREVLVDVHRRLPQEQQSAVPLFSMLAQRQVATTPLSMGGR